MEQEVEKRLTALEQKVEGLEKDLNLHKMREQHPDI